LVLDEKAQPHSYTRHTTLLGALSVCEKIKDFKCTLWSKKCGNHQVVCDQKDIENHCINTLRAGLRSIHTSISA